MVVDVEGAGGEEVDRSSLGVGLGGLPCFEESGLLRLCCRFYSIKLTELKIILFCSNSEIQII